MKRSDWAERPERSNPALLRLMIWLSLWLGRPFGRVLLRLIALCSVAVLPAARDASRDYLRRVLSRIATLCDVSRHMLTFATTIHDRAYLISGRFGLFSIQLQGRQHVHNVLAQRCDTFLLDAHLGNFEVVYVLGRMVPDLHMAVAMYEENACNINATVTAISPAAAPEVIPLGRVDAMLQVREALDDSWLIGMLADRTLLRDAGPSVRHMDLLDSPTAFPLGLLHMAAVFKHPVLFMTGLHLGGNRYAVHSDLLVSFTDVHRKDHAATMQAALGHYVERVKHYYRTASYNWFSYFDFWQNANATGTPDHAPADHQTTQAP